MSGPSFYVLPNTSLRNLLQCSAHMLDATLVMGGVGGVGWGCSRSVTLHTWWMLRNCISFARGHMLDATPDPQGFLEELETLL